MLNFWNVMGINQLRDADDVQSALDQVAGRLAGASPLDLTLFVKQLHEYLYRLDMRVFAEIEVTTAGGGTLSQTNDHFLYARCACVLAGEPEFTSALRTKAGFERFVQPKLQGAEGLLYVAEAVYENKTGRKMNVSSDFPLDWMSNTQGW